MWRKDLCKVLLEVIAEGWQFVEGCAFGNDSNWCGFVLAGHQNCTCVQDCAHLGGTVNKVQANFACLLAVGITLEYVVHNVLLATKEQGDILELEIYKVNGAVEQTFGRTTLECLVDDIRQILAGGHLFEVLLFWLGCSVGNDFVEVALSKAGATAHFGVDEHFALG